MNTELKMNKHRLIDANELNFVCSYNGMCMGTNEKCKKCEYYVCSFEDVQNQPTAYDPDKIVEQLEQEAELTHLNKMEERVGKKQTVGFALGIRDAIKIVKGGLDGSRNDSTSR